MLHGAARFEYEQKGSMSQQGLSGCILRLAVLLLLDMLSFGHAGCTGKSNTMWLTTTPYTNTTPKSLVHGKISLTAQAFGLSTGTSGRICTSWPVPASIRTASTVFAFGNLEETLFHRFCLWTAVATWHVSRGLTHKTRATFGNHVLPPCARGDLQSFPYTVLHRK